MKKQKYSFVYLFSINIRALFVADNFIKPRRFIVAVVFTLVPQNDLDLFYYFII